MKTAYATSPFRTTNCTDEWIQWQKDQPIYELQEIHTDRKSVDSQEPGDVVSVEKGINIPRIYRPQYNAVLERFSQASKRTGTFSSWTT